MNANNMSHAIARVNADSTPRYSLSELIGSVVGVEIPSIDPSRYYAFVCRPGQFIFVGRGNAREFVRVHGGDPQILLDADRQRGPMELAIVFVARGGAYLRFFRLQQSPAAPRAE